MSRVLVVALLVLLAACASTDDAAAPESVASGDVRVGLVDFDITLAADAVTPGRHELAVTNAGAAAHDLVVSDGADRRAATAVLRPGEQEDLIVDAEAGGTLTLWCSVPGHRAQGMELRLPVSS